MKMLETNAAKQDGRPGGTSHQAQDDARGGTQLLWPRQITFPAVSGHPGHLPIARITRFQENAGLWGAQDQARSGWMLAADQSGTTMDELLSDQEPPQAFLPAAEQLLDDPAASLWFKSALSAALARDPVQAANEAQVLAQILNRRADAVLKQSCQERLTAPPAHGGRENHTFQLP
jgi:hypothetical protein